MHHLASQQAASCSGRISRCNSTTVQRSGHARSRRSRLCVNALLKPAAGVPVSWHQTTDEVLIKVPVEPGVRGRDVVFEVHPTRLRLDVGGTTLLAGSLEGAGAILADECFWVLEEDEASGRHVAINLAKATSGYESWAALLEEDLPDDSITHRMALDVKIGDSLGRLVLGLYGNVVPQTVENFRALVTGERGTSPSGTPLTFAGSPFHRIIPGFMAQGGDITTGDGRGGESIYGPSFPDENFKLKHSGRGILAMANAGPNTNNSQFYITFMPTPHLDGKHVVFGTVEAGWSTLMRLEGAGTDSGQPVTPVTIVAARELDLATDPQAAVDELEQDTAAREEALAAEFVAQFDAAAVAAGDSDSSDGSSEQQQRRPRPTARTVVE